MDQVFNSLTNIPNQIIFSFNEEIANGMPLVNPQRRIFNLGSVDKTKPYSEKLCTTSSSFSAPSNGSTADAFFKARISFSPVYHHNELATKYAHISTIPDKSSEIKYSIMRFV